MDALQDASYASAASIRLCSSGRRVHWSVAVITRGPLRVRGKRSSVCPSIKKGIPKASRQIDGERAREADGARGEAEQEKNNVAAGYRGTLGENKRTTGCEPAYVRADHEKRTDATRQTVDVHQRTFPSPNILRRIRQT